ncbi:MAG: glycoside hydrolase family 13 protein [Pseudonocardiales bacterium]|nr:glycoside hydrolase family 13 protein [Pseudonocardiales bacterium]
MSAQPATQWWRDAVCYQVYVRSFADSNGDGVGDLDGIRGRLGYLADLGVDAVWITPFYRSPMADGGYDVADPRDVDPLFGDLEAFDALVHDAHERGIRIIIDLVPNHTSSQHRWFQEAVASPPGSPERARFHFRPGRGPDDSEPPNNWPSQFGGPAWHQAGAEGQREWYLHLFAPEQPDLNWHNPEVHADLEETLRFWLDRGADGFRIDVAHGMAKPAGLPDAEAAQQGLISDSGGDVRFDHDDVHEVHRLMRRVVDDYPDRVLLGEIWVRNDARFAMYLRPDELHLGFNFRLAEAPYGAEDMREAIEHSLHAVAEVGATPTWTLSNHDVTREVTRYGGGELGLRRARAMALVELALPGVIFVYNGEELGLANVELPDEALQDPVWERSGHTSRGRDGGRVPVPWDGDEPGFGFTTGRPWLPMPTEWSKLTVAAQLDEPRSTLSLYRRAIELRHEHRGFASALDWLPAPDGCFAYRRAGSSLVCMLNTSAEAVPLPAGEVLLSSAKLVDGLLPPDTAVWVA